MRLSLPQPVHTRSAIGKEHCLLGAEIRNFCWADPDSKVHGANMGPIWGRQDPGGPHVGPMNIAILDVLWNVRTFCFRRKRIFLCNSIMQSRQFWITFELPTLDVNRNKFHFMYLIEKSCWNKYNGYIYASLHAVPIQKNGLTGALLLTGLILIPAWISNYIHWGRVTHICVNKLTIIGSNNGLSPGRRQALIWTNAGILLIGPLGTNFSEILIEI